MNQPQAASVFRREFARRLNTAVLQAKAQTSPRLTAFARDFFGSPAPANKKSTAIAVLFLLCIGDKKDIFAFFDLGLNSRKL